MGALRYPFIISLALNIRQIDRLQFTGLVRERRASKGSNRLITPRATATGRDGEFVVCKFPRVCVFMCVTLISPHPKVRFLFPFLVCLRKHTQINNHLRSVAPVVAY